MQAGLKNAYESIKPFSETGYGEARNPEHNNPGRNEYLVPWDRVTRRHVLRAIQKYDRLGPEQFFPEHGFAPTTTYELVWDKHRYPPKAILGAAYECATGQQLGSGDFEGRKTGAVRVLGELGFTSRRSYDQPGKTDPDMAGEQAFRKDLPHPEVQFSRSVTSR